MANRYQPEGYPSVMPYLILDDASPFLPFVKAVFDAEELLCMKDDNGAIQHAAVRIGDAVVEFATGNAEWKARPGALHVYVADTDSTFKKAIGAGAKSLYEPADMFYGERSGGVQDPCGNQWYIATQTEVLSLDEIKRREKEMAK